MDGLTRQKLKVAAKRRRLTPSATVRLAVDKGLDDRDAVASLQPYEAIEELVGSVSGGDRLRSSRSIRARRRP
jgi:hypothetical protein